MVTVATDVSSSVITARILTIRAGDFVARSGSEVQTRIALINTNSIREDLGVVGLIRFFAEWLASQSGRGLPHSRTLARCLTTLGLAAYAPRASQLKPTAYTRVS